MYSAVVAPEALWIVEQQDFSRIRSGFLIGRVLVPAVRRIRNGRVRSLAQLHRHSSVAGAKAPPALIRRVRRLAGGGRPQRDNTRQVIARG